MRCTPDPSGPTDPTDLVVPGAGPGRWRSAPRVREALVVMLAVLLAALLAVVCGTAVAEAGAPTPAPAPAPGTESGAGRGTGTKPGPDGGRSWPLAGRPAVMRSWEPPAGPYARGHRGVDLAAEPGAAVLAAASGQVSFAGRVAGRGVLAIEVAGER